MSTAVTFEEFEMLVDMSNKRFSTFQKEMENFEAITSKLRTLMTNMPISDITVTSVMQVNSKLTEVYDLLLHNEAKMQYISAGMQFARESSDALKKVKQKMGAVLTEEEEQKYFQQGIGFYQRDNSENAHLFKGKSEKLTGVEVRSSTNDGLSLVKKVVQDIQAKKKKIGENSQGSYRTSLNMMLALLKQKKLKKTTDNPIYWINPITGKDVAFSIAKGNYVEYVIYHLEGNELKEVGYYHEDIFPEWLKSMRNAVNARNSVHSSFKHLKNLRSWQKGVYHSINCRFLPWESWKDVTTVI